CLSSWMLSRKERQRIWHQGFDQARFMGAKCPYSAGSDQAEAWENGWAEGVIRRHGAPHDSVPPAAGWRRLMKLLLGR
uniref:hypothetical protein n=1 Tax=Azohydromonas aeria TaxID=2590212 RepID=UPI001E5274DC